MSTLKKNNRPLSEEELQELVASSDSGARKPTGSVALLMAIVAITWSMFQIILASPLSPYLLPADLINNSRQLHLAFAIFLAFLAYPALKSSPRHRIPIQDWLFALAGVFLALYGFFFYDKIVDNGGLADHVDKWFALAGLLLLFEAARRALGPAMATISIIFLAYVFFGSSDWVPEVIRWKGASLQKAMSHMWITSEGVFGIALDVSTKFVFLFVLFGALLDKAGAGNYFIQMAFGALGHLKGGPAKAAVIGSAATGLISGSSIANVVTTGTFTIPLMKRVGFTPEQAGSVEVAASVNGQIMPPVMGAAAFLMVEYVGIPYTQVIKHAVLPAVISYIAIFYIVHLEAVKRNMPVIGHKAESTLRTVMGMILFFLGFSVLCYAVKYPVQWIVTLVPEGSGWLLAVLVFIAYAGLLKLAATVNDLKPDDMKSEVVLPEVSKIYKSGLHYLLPIVVLVYFLMIEQKSPGLSAFWASMLLFVILLTQHPLKAFFRGQAVDFEKFKLGAQDLISGLTDGARNMIGIGLATAAAGVIVGTVTLTGVGQVMADLVEFLSGGNLLLMLIFVALLSLILGMGLPTTANYIVVSSLMAGVVVELGAQSGLIVPLIAVHMFVFFFGIMADVTPPVGLASFAAAAVAGGDPIKTGITAFYYSLRTILLPFLFIFNTDLLLIDVTWYEATYWFIIATLGMLVFTAATMNYFQTNNKWYETVGLLLVTFLLLRPGFFMDCIQPPFEKLDPIQLENVMSTVESDREVRLVVSGPDFLTGKDRQTTIVLVAGEPGSGTQRLAKNGLVVSEEGGVVKIEEPIPSSQFFNTFKNFDFYGEQPVAVKTVKVSQNQLPKELFFIPGFLILGLIYMVQRKRLEKINSNF